MLPAVARTAGRESSIRMCPLVLFIVTYSAVAITADSKFIPFGPAFESEEKAWEWLHFECDLWPVHKEIEVYAMQPGNVINFWGE